MTPILSGQHSTEKNRIPPYQAKKEAPAESGDLIDFGQNDTDVEQTLRSTSTSNREDNQGSLIDFQEDLRSSLPQPSQKLQRKDTGTNSLDEFLDAQG